MRAARFFNFDAFIASCDVQLLKPDEKIFKLALEKADVLPSETIYIDDLAENVQSAKKMGMDAILFKGYQHLVAQLEDRGIRYKNSSLSLQP